MEVLCVLLGENFSNSYDGSGTVFLIAFSLQCQCLRSLGWVCTLTVGAVIVFR